MIETKRGRSEYKRDDRVVRMRGPMLSRLGIVPCRPITIPYLVRPTSAVFANDGIPVRLTESARDTRFLVVR